MNKPDIGCARDLSEQALRVDGRLAHQAARSSSRPCGGPVVHVVDPDGEAARRLAGVLASVGVQCCTYAGLGAFATEGGGDLPGCLVVDADVLDGAAQGLAIATLGVGYPVVVTAYRPDVTTAVRAMRTGAVDFLEKPFGEADILDAISRALEEDRSQRVLAARRAELVTRHATLSHRERQVMALVTAGRLNKQAAWELGLSEITIKAHRGAVMRKMRARTLAELVRMADMLGVEPTNDGRSPTQGSAQQPGRDRADAPTDFAAR